ncbi:transporter substrate-binding domain-containing protein, partial [Enterobacter asburiae]
VGHRESSVPFSYYDNQQKVVGYSQDYSNAIVEAVKKKLNKPDLQVKLIPITSQNRIPSRIVAMSFCEPRSCRGLLS